MTQHQQAQSFSEISVGDGASFTINQIIQPSPSTVHDRPFNETSPYRGLERFDSRDKDLFFGRDQLIAQLMQSVSQQSFMLLLGASGGGKSSLVQAGLIPQLFDRLGSRFQSFIFTPDRDPFDGLRASLKGNRYSDAQADIALKRTEQTLLEVINTLKEPNAQWLIFIDQFEELFTLCPDPQQRQTFIEALVQVAQQNIASVKLILAMRSDFLDRISPYPALNQLAQDKIQLVSNLCPDELRLAIAQPAAVHGVTLEPGLVDEIIQDLQGQAGSLPLLQYTLNLLWEQEDLSDRTLNIKTYRRLGGVRGALQKHVSEIYRSLTPEEQDAARTIFLRLVDITHVVNELESPGKAVSRRAYLSEFTGDIIKRILEKLIARKLLISDRHQYATVELAHEVLISSWPTLTQWIEESKEKIFLKNRLAEDVKRWQTLCEQDPTTAEDELWQGWKLQRVQELQTDDAFQRWLGGLTPEEQEFVQTSEKLALARQQRELEQERKLRKAAQRTAAIAGISLAFVTLLTSVAGYQWRAAEHGEIRALVTSANAKYEANPKTLDALLESLEAGHKLRRSLWARFDRKLRADVLQVLGQSTNWVQERERLIDHRDAVRSLSFSPDGQTIATVGRDRVIRLWSPDGKPLQEITAHENDITSVAFSPDGQWIGTASVDKTARIWTLDGEPVYRLEGHTKMVNAITFSPDGTTIATVGDDGALRLWQTTDGQPLKPVEAAGNGTYLDSVAFNHDSSLVATGGGDDVVRLWRVSDGQQVRELKGHTDDIRAIAFSPDRTSMATASFDGTVKLWNLNDVDGGPKYTFNGEPSDRLDSIAFSPDGQTLAAAGKNAVIYIWSIEGKLINTLRGHGDRITRVQFQPNSSNPEDLVLASAGYDKEVKLWQFDHHWVKQISTNQNRINSVAIGFDKQHQQFATAHRNGTIHLWSPNGEWLQILKGHNQANPVTSINFSPSGEWIASGSFDKTVRLWTTKGEAGSVLPQPEAVYSVSFSRDSQTLSVASGKIVRLLTLNGEELGIFNHLDEVYSTQFSRDDNTLISSSKDGTLHLWDVQQQRKIHMWVGHEGPVHNAKFSPDGTLIASVGDDNEGKLWQLDGTEIATLRGHNAPIGGLDFSPDSQMIATASDDNTIKLWTRNGVLITTLIGHQTAVNSVVFSPDGKWLLSGSEDSIAMIWDLDALTLDASIQRGCSWFDAFSPSMVGQVCEKFIPAFQH